MRAQPARPAPPPYDPAFGDPVRMKTGMARMPGRGSARGVRWQVVGDDSPSVGIDVKDLSNSQAKSIKRWASAVLVVSLPVLGGCTPNLSGGVMNSSNTTGSDTTGGTTGGGTAKTGTAGDGASVTGADGHSAHRDGAPGANGASGGAGGTAVGGAGGSATGGAGGTVLGGHGSANGGDAVGGNGGDASANGGNGG